MPCMHTNWTSTAVFFRWIVCIGRTHDLPQILVTRPGYLFLDTLWIYFGTSEYVLERQINRHPIFPNIFWWHFSLLDRRQGKVTRQRFSGSERHKLSQETVYFVIWYFLPDFRLIQQMESLLIIFEKRDICLEILLSEKRKFFQQNTDEASSFSAWGRAGVFDHWRLEVGRKEGVKSHLPQVFALWKQLQLLLLQYQLRLQQPDGMGSLEASSGALFAPSQICYWMLGCASCGKDSLGERCYSIHRLPHKYIAEFAADCSVSMAKLHSASPTAAKILRDSILVTL